MRNDAHRDRPRSPRRALAAALAILMTLAGLALASTPASAADSRDVARDGTATARSVYTLSGSFAAAHVNDGDATTRWGSRYTRTNPADTYDTTGEWVQIALAKPTYILKVVLDWEAAYSTDYEIQVSNDGAEWTSLRRVTTPTGQAVAGHLVQQNDVDTSDAWSYVRVLSHSVATKYGLSLYSFEVWDQPTSTPPGEARDLARDGTTTAKSSYNTTTFAPANATDGDPATRWGSFYTRTTPAYDNRADWIQVELAEPSRIHTVVLNWEAAYGRTFLLQVSRDGSSWTTVHEGGATGAGAQQIVVDTPDAWSFVRMQGVETAGIYGYSLFDFEVWGAAKPPVVEPEPQGGDIVPKPVSRTDADGPAFALGAGARIVAPAAFAGVAEQLAATLRAGTGFAIPVMTGPAADGDVVLTEGDAKTGGDKAYQREQGYRLHADAARVTITAQAEAGAWNGTRTLLQLLPAWVLAGDPDLAVAWTVPATEIVDHPRLEQRGLMIDPARNFITVDAVKAIIDQASLAKMNRLHMHPTDDQGWRIEITSWPKLTSHGASSSMKNGQSGFYTQAQFRDIVTYAAARQVTVIPEIDVPGHVDAALSSYPVLDCAERTIPIRTTGGISTNSLCIGKPVVEEFLRDVIGEVAAMTPGEYVHIGADEVEGVSTEQYGSFIRMVEQIAADNGKKIIGWTPMPQAAPSASAVHQYWADRKNHLATSWFQGRDVILSPVNNAYMDYKFPGAPLGFREAIYSTKFQYDWDPTRVVDATTKKNLNTSFGLTEDDVQGVEAAAWGETFLRGGEDVEYMLWPRTLGIADKGWSTKADTASFADFAQRSGAHGARMLVQGQNFWADPELSWRTELAGMRIAADESGAVEGVVAQIAAPRVPRAQLSAAITWPDGQTSVGTIDGKDAAGADAASVFTVTGAHAAQPAAAAGTGSVRLTGPGGLDVSAPFTVTAAPVDPPVIVLSATSVAAGSTLTVDVAGLGSGERVTFALHSDPVDMGAAVADASGTVSLAWKVPTSTPAGAHTVVMTRADGATVSAALQVTAAPDPGGEPGTGGPGASGPGSGSSSGGGLAGTGLDPVVAAIGLAIAALLIAAGAVAVRRRRAG
ncbi:family 20 glycosylhydrolase [Streptomyces sp. AC495_CC817]|uniref:family 20 glycosylhydrolase n=1 Tax=Streptomyces sp. AC495_CC817 TaxID=2823900 RepID=UPI001C278419|nr:family 20 glycosylhydrolase [Streptomyces sp. AC495_CC817]